MRLVPVRGYAELDAALGDSAEVNASRHALNAWLQMYPERGGWMPDLSMQVVRTQRQPGFAPLEIYYRHVGDVVYLCDIRRYDDLGDGDSIPGS